MVLAKMYTIKQAAGRTGISVQLVRAWERRYGVVEPSRTSSGYRLYDDAAIARLRAMRSLVTDGWAPSTAAARIRELDDVAVYALAARARAPRRSDGNGESTPASLPARSLTDAFVTSAETLNERGFERVLDEMFASGSFEQVASGMLMPALVALGDAWESGKVDVAGEHAAAGAIQRRLGMAFLAAGLPTEEDVVLVGLPPGARHDLGALAFATAARRAGVAVRYLGADLPVADWLDAVARTQATAVVIGAIIGGDVQPAAKVARAIRDAHPDVLIGFGGRDATSVKTDGLDPVVTLPQDLQEAVGVLRSELVR